jgi:hypothetical protein
MELKDTHNKFGEITKLTEKYVFFGEVKKLKKNIDPKDLIYYYSSDINIDWKDANAVKSFYETFQYWRSVVRNGDYRKPSLLMVKDNMVEFENEYYLPYYYGEPYVDKPQEKRYLGNCMVFGYCCKVHNGHYQVIDGKIKHSENFVNLFYIERFVTKEEIIENENKINNFKQLSTIEYLKSLNLNKLNSNDLKLFKSNFNNLFDLSIFPLTTKNNVRFYIDSNFGTITFMYRNRRGYLKVDNGFYGRTLFGNDYYLIILGSPYFTNEHSTYSRVEGSSITFDASMLESLSKEIESRFNRAIENNYTLFPKF